MSTTAIASTTTFLQSATQERDPERALAALDTELKFSEADAVILFVSSEYDLGRLQQAIAARVKVPVLCCTTAGEISRQFGYTTGGIVGSSIKGCRTQVVALPKLSGEHEGYESALLQAAQEVTRDDSNTTIGLIVLDGLCLREELVIERLQLAIPHIPIVGGSAGDACKFKQTFVMIDGKFQSDAGALLLLSGNFRASVFQTHHYTSTGIRVVATEVDTPSRRLLKLDGMPALTRLAQLFSCGVEDLTNEKLATRPMMLRSGDMFFLRGVQSVHPDGSICFYCAVRKGEVLHLSKCGEIVDVMSSYLDALSQNDSKPNLLIGFDCISRRLELMSRGKIAEMSAVFKQVPYLGFSTFGEQYHGEHINQTMTGVAFWNR
jgi:hypothetical protein